MKRLFFNILFIIAASSLYSQSHTPCLDCDTIPSRYNKYYYYSWYDECVIFDEEYRLDSCQGIKVDLQNNSFMGVAKWEYTESRLKVIGLVALVDYANLHFKHYRDTTKLAEWMYLFQLGPNEEMILLDSVRWDNKHPHYMEFPSRDASSDSHQYCYAYESYFGKPNYVDSTFYIMGTCNSNQREGNSSVWYLNIPTFYTYVDAESYNFPLTPCHYEEIQCIAPGDVKVLAWPMHGIHDTTNFWMNPWAWNPYGLFLAIVANDSLHVQTSNPSMGSVYGGGYLPDSTWYQIGAHPKPGYRFSHWNDSVTDNPRQVFLLSDTTFTAYFEEGGVFSVDATCNNDEWGHVNGSGIYPENSIVELDAVAEENCLFVVWSDSVTDNPRFVTVTCDTVFTALFDTVSTSTIHSAESGNGLRVSPNPVHGKLCIEVDEDGEHVAEIFDMVGTLVLNVRFSGHRKEIHTKRLAKGRYILRVTCAKGRSSRPFVVE